MPSVTFPGNVLETLRRTPLYAEHNALGAKLITFAGFEMPVRYTGVLEEHMAVRQAAGLFDVSHMGEILVTGNDAEAFLQNLITNDIRRIHDGQALYTVMCQENGGIIDDLLVYRFSSTDFMLVVNASNVDKVLAWLRQHQIANAKVVDLSDTTALIALQGPKAKKILALATGRSFDELAPFQFIQTNDELFPGVTDILISATGYTGEKGFEIYVAANDAVVVWRSLLEAGRPIGLKPAGLSARDTLRMEAGFSLYGNDISEKTTPLEAGLEWITKLDKGAFVGSDAISRQKHEKPARRLIAFVMEERGIPRRGFAVVSDTGEPIGNVTSGSQSPVLGAGIGMGYVENDKRYTTPGMRIGIDVRGKVLQAIVKKPPLHK